MGNNFLNRYLNKNIFEKYIAPDDVMRDLYRKLVFCINSTPSNTGNEISDDILNEFRSNFLYVVKHQISNNRTIYNSGKLIGELNLHMIEKNVPFKFTIFSRFSGTGKEPPVWANDYIGIFLDAILPDAFPYIDWDEHKINELSSTVEKNMRTLIKKYLMFNSKVKFDYKDDLCIDSLVKFYKRIISESNVMRRENKFNYRQFVPTIASEFVINWKNLRELV
jgi:hypothetical protein